MNPNSTFIFRIIHQNNLPEILKDGYIYCCNLLKKMGKPYYSIAYVSIMDRRKSTKVICGPRGCLLDYVAFYFAPRSPMLYTLNKGNVEGFTGGQEDLIYIVSTAQKVEREGIGFAFTDGHGIISFTKYFDDLSHLCEIDWDIMKAKYWFDTDNDPDRKRRRQAEFLVYKRFPWDLVDEIAVLTVQMKKHVETMLDKFGYKTYVKIKPEWYY